WRALPETLSWSPGLVRKEFRLEVRLHEASWKSDDGDAPFREGGIRLNRFLSILRTLIFDSRVEGGMPSLVAAPNGPATRPMASSRAASITERSSSPNGCLLAAAS